MKQRAEAAPQNSAEVVRQNTYRAREWNNENVLHVYPYTFNEQRHAGEKHRGIGSILGITSKLDWMRDTGVTAIWLGPIYESPGLDGNYDISNYYRVNPELGTMGDVKELLDKAHERDIRVVFDLVPNHTSDESEWFKASGNPDDPGYEKYKDYYIWRDAAHGELPKNIVGGDRLANLPTGLTVPNNWTSIFSLPQIDIVRQQYGGEIPSGVDVPALTAWVWNEARQQFYLAEFMKQQPTLNWQNPAVREEIKNVVRFWLNLGVDGFRVDALNHIGKDPEFRDEERAVVGAAMGEYSPGMTNPHDQWKQEKMVSYWPNLGQYTQELLSVLDEEAYAGKNIRYIFEDWMSALSDDDRLNKLRPDKANVFNFETLLNTTRQHWTAKNIGKIIQRYYARMAAMPGAAPNQVTGNHDTDTLRTRLGCAATAQAAHLMLASLPGALYTWQGDVLGRPNYIVPKELQRDGDVGKRDGERIPMQWDESLNGGFSQASLSELWLPTADERFYQADNIDLQVRDPRSPYRFVKAILKRRKNDAAFSGGLRILHTDNAGVLAFARSDPLNKRRQVIAVTNFTQDTTTARLLDTQQTSGKITLSATNSRERGDQTIDLSAPITLAPDEAYLIDSTA